MNERIHLSIAFEEGMENENRMKLFRNGSVA